MKNDWWGITGEWSVDFIIVYLDQCKEFEDLLPNKTKEQIGQEGELENYHRRPQDGEREGEWPRLKCPSIHREGKVKEDSVPPASLFPSFFCPCCLPAAVM